MSQVKILNVLLDNFSKIELLEKLKKISQFRLTKKTD